MSTMRGGGCGVLIGAVIVVLTFYITTALFPGIPILSYIIVGIVLVITMPFVCKAGAGGGRYRLIHKGGYGIDVQEVSPQKAGYYELDTSFVSRVVVDMYSDEEVIISGKPETSYRDACLKNWNFDSISKKSDWIIIDEKGNDITDKSLSSYQGIAKIQSTEPMDRRVPYDTTEDAIEATEDYSDMERGVEFYD